MVVAGDVHRGLHLHAPPDGFFQDTLAYRLRPKFPMDQKLIDGPTEICTAQPPTQHGGASVLLLLTDEIELEELVTYVTRHYTCK